MLNESAGSSNVGGAPDGSPAAGSGASSGGGGAVAGGIIGVLEHGTEAQARQALTYLAQPPHLTEHVQRLEAALARRGWPHPFPATAVAA